MSVNIMLPYSKAINIKVVNEEGDLPVTFVDHQYGEVITTTLTRTKAQEIVNKLTQEFGL